MKYPDAATPHAVSTTRCTVGENPLWHAEEGCLYWCDIPNGVLLRYNPSTGEETQFDLGRPIGGFTIQHDGSLLLLLDRGTVLTWRDGVVQQTIIHELTGESETRFNDAIVDRLGRVLCGTMSTPQRKGRLYRLDRDGTIHSILENLGCSNGMAFSRDGRYLFHTDSTAQQIHRYRYNLDAGTLGDRTLFAHFTQGEGVPDGATIDSEDQLWSARWNGSSLVRYASDGTVERLIEMPTAKPSSLTFGGPNLDDIYITTASLNEQDSGAGLLYCCSIGIRGVAEFRSRIGAP